MSREELIGKIHEEERLWKGFLEEHLYIRGVVELADGVMAASYNVTADAPEVELIVYFDNTKCQILEDSQHGDFSSNMDEFPEGIGLIISVEAKNWEDIFKTARESLGSADGLPPIKWHEKPVEIDY